MICPGLLHPELALRSGSIWPTGRSPIFRTEPRCVSFWVTLSSRFPPDPSALKVPAGKEEGFCLAQAMTKCFTMSMTIWEVYVSLKMVMASSSSALTTILTAQFPAVGGGNLVRTTPKNATALAGRRLQARHPMPPPQAQTHTWTSAPASTIPAQPFG